MGLNQKNMEAESYRAVTHHHHSNNDDEDYSWYALFTKARCRQQDVKVHSLRLHPDHRLDKGQCFIVMCTGISISMYIFVQITRISFNLAIFILECFGELHFCTPKCFEFNKQRPHSWNLSPRGTNLLKHNRQYV